MVASLKAQRTQKENFLGFFMHTGTMAKPCAINPLTKFRSINRELEHDVYQFWSDGPEYSAAISVQTPDT